MQSLSLETTLNRLHHSRVRDLAWTLLSPPLIPDQPQQRHPLAASPWLDGHSLSNWLSRLDAAPAPLEDWLAQRSNRRLGLYYERLWQFALIHAPEVELLASNLAIRRSGQTLGELDLLLSDADGIWHLELALKLYLGVQQEAGLSWIGPGGVDRLDLKLARLLDHQLPLPAQPEAQAELTRLNVEGTRSRFWLAGYLFLPWRSTQGEAMKLCWVRRHDWAAFADAHPGALWQPLPRQAWLAPARLNGSEIMGREGFGEWLARLPSLAPAQLLAQLERAGPDDYRETTRVFLANEQWPTAQQWRLRN
ncbi:DUF1853 family protein [Stutzerimonas tarimensis]|uniref:DUF1853 family protein n=1 Tax=Stutzerimonas tarimensis TaxID=1507735 RepID=A0ABV7T2A3_9GAMM